MGGPLQLLWKNCIFDLCGVPAFHREMFTVVVTSTYDERQGWLREVKLGLSMESVEIGCGQSALDYFDARSLSSFDFIRI